MKRCGRNEDCFENIGDTWGHLSGVLCFHLVESDQNVCMCGKTNEPVELYTTKEEYKLLGGIA